MSYCGKNKRELGVTNLTLLDIPAYYGNYEIKNIIFVPPAVSYCQNVVFVLMRVRSTREKDITQGKA